MLGFIGGTGPEGKGLALRLAMAGESVFIGSRSETNGAEAAELVNSMSKSISSDGHAQGGTNYSCAQACDIAFVCVPYPGHKETLSELEHLLRGKIVIDVVAPLKFKKGQVSSIDVPEGSAAEQAKTTLPTSRVVGAFHNVSAQDLLKPDKSIDSDVIVCSDDNEAKLITISLAEKIISIRGIDGGKLENSKYVEDFTALLLNINKIYKGHSSIKLTGI